MIPLRSWIIIVAGGLAAVVAVSVNGSPVQERSSVPLHALKFLGGGPVLRWAKGELGSADF